MSNPSIDNILREAGVAYQSTSEMTLVDLARKGISKKSLLKIADVGSISVKQLADLLPVSLRTIQRYDNDDLLSPEISSHALSIAEVLAKGLEIFDHKKQLQRWLHTPSVAFRMQTPLSLLDTSFGARMVIDELGRLEHGVYA